MLRVKEVEVRRQCFRQYLRQRMSARRLIDDLVFEAIRRQTSLVHENTLPYAFRCDRMYLYLGSEAGTECFSHAKIGAEHMAASQGRFFLIRKNGDAPEQLGQVRIYPSV